jgi:hypothetical protein
MCLRNNRVNIENSAMHEERSNDLLSCFVSAPSGVILSKIRELLSVKGVKFIHPSEIILSGQNIREKISEAISQSDLFLAVFDQAHESGNTFFELGIAAALKKQIIILSPPNFEIPSDLTGFLYLRTDAENTEALGFAIDQLLEAPIRKKKKILPKKRSKATKQSSIKVAELVEKSNLLGPIVTDYELERFVAEMLKESGVSIVIVGQPKGAGADLAIWSDDLGSILGNPILIETRKNIRTHDQAKQITNQLLGYLDKTNSRSALVLYLEGLSSREAQKTAEVFNVFFFQIGELLQQLQDKSLVEIVRTRRNIVAHGGDV